MSMKKIMLVASILIGTTNIKAQTVIDQVLKTYGNKWPKTLSFTQTTTLFTANGEVKQTWFEAGSLPKYFRIDFNRDKGNSVIFNGNTSFRFKEHKLVQTGVNNNPLIYLLGGMYFEKIDTVNSKLTKLGVDIKTQEKGVWKGKSVQILGAKAGDTTKTQLWFDTKELYLVRFIQHTGKDLMDIHFAGQKKIGSTWHEMIVDIYQNGKIIQKEEYADFKTNITLDERIFDPNQFGKIHWLN